MTAQQRPHLLLCQPLATFAFGATRKSMFMLISAGAQGLWTGVDSGKIFQSSCSQNFFTRLKITLLTWQEQLSLLIRCDWVGSGKNNFLSMSESDVLIWTSQPYPRKMSGVVSFGEDSLSLALVWCTQDQKEGKKPWKRKRTIFLLLWIGCHNVKKYQHLCKGNRIVADKEMNEGCFKREKSYFTDLELDSVLRCNLKGN